MARQRNIGMLVLSRLVGICAFIVLLLLANWLATAWGNTAMLATVVFLNATFGIVLLFSFTLLIGEVIGALAFPFNLAAPPFNAVGAVVLAWFVFRMFSLVDTVSGVGVASRIAWLEPLVYPLVFLAVFVFGYAAIFLRRCCAQSGGVCCPAAWNGDERREKRARRAREWGEVADEFRGTLLDGFKRARVELRGTSQAKPESPRRDTKKKKKKK